MSELDFDFQEILKAIPHRYPFLLIDRILELKVNESIVAIKNVTANEPFFTGHFPGRPIMPGVLIVEALAQASGILASQSLPASEGNRNLFLLAGVDNVRFKQMVTPGDQLRLEVESVRFKRSIGKSKAIATVDGQLVCSAEITCAQKEVEE